MNQFFHFQHEEFKDLRSALAIIKSEGPKFEDDNLQIVKKEEIAENELEILQNFSFIGNVNKKIDQHLASLNQYLQNFVGRILL